MYHIIAIRMQLFPKFNTRSIVVVVFRISGIILIFMPCVPFDVFTMPNVEYGHGRSISQRGRSAKVRKPGKQRTVGSPEEFPPAFSANIRAWMIGISTRMELL